MAAVAPATTRSGGKITHLDPDPWFALDFERAIVCLIPTSSGVIPIPVYITKRFLTVQHPYPATVVVCDQGAILRVAKEVARR